MEIFTIKLENYNTDVPALEFGCFSDEAGISLRYTYITDEDNVVTEIIKSEEIPVERDFNLYKEKFGI